MFKAFVSKSHPEFSSNRQQDAQEFFLHLVNLVEVSQPLELLESVVRSVSSPRVQSPLRGQNAATPWPLPVWFLLELASLGLPLFGPLVVIAPQAWLSRPSWVSLFSS